MENLLEKFQKVEELVGFKKGDGWINVNGILAKSLWSNGFAITHKRWPEDSNAIWPFHIHTVSQILVVLKGEFKIDFRCGPKSVCGGLVQTMTVRPTASITIDPDMEHMITPLVPGGEILSITMPSDPFYKSLFETVK